MVAEDLPRQPHILVIEDDSGTNRVLRRILEHAGYATTPAYSAREAEDRAGERVPDMVLLDLELPDANGLDVCRNLKARAGWRHTPVIVVSADDQLCTKVKGFEAGAADFIPKPFACEEVLARASTHLRLKRAYEELARLQADRVRGLSLAQEVLMPRPEEMPEARFAVRMTAAQHAGGDFYEVRRISSGVIDYVVADASGHDLAAAFWTAALKALLGEYVSPVHGPRDALHAINRAMCRLLPSGVFFTAIYARLNRTTGTLTLASAGHPPAVVLRRSQGRAAPVEQSGDVIGSFPDADFGVVQLPVQRGDRFFLYSDGMVEVAGQTQLRPETLCRACEAHAGAELATNVAEVSRMLVGGTAAADDWLLLGVEV
jgi:sigma-B regulation protein RsbU (phosphoserine phosphatase)